MVNTDLKRQFERYRDEVGDEWQQETLAKRDRIQELLAASDLDELDEGDVRALVRTLWAFGRWTSKDYIVEQILVNGLDPVQGALASALHDCDGPGAQFERLRTIPYFGTTTSSEVLMFMYPDSHAICNDKALDGYHELVEVVDRDGNLPASADEIESGAAYEQYLTTLDTLRTDLDAIASRHVDFLVLNEFLYYLDEHPPDEPRVREFDHDTYQDKLAEIGDGLGFEVEKEYPAARRAVVDVVWRTRVANLGRISYAFEIHSEGSPDSAILNLQKIRSEDPSIQRVVIVSDTEQLATFREEIQAIDGAFSTAVSFMTPYQVQQAQDHLGELRDILQSVDLLQDL